MSNAVSDQTTDLENNRNLSDYVYVFGQFLDHDLDLTNEAGTENSDIQIPAGDLSFDPTGTGTQVMPLTKHSGQRILLPRHRSAAAGRWRWRRRGSREPTGVARGH